MKAHGYKFPIDSTHKLVARVDEQGWVISLESSNGDWKPSIRSKQPIWEDARKWQTVPQTFGLEPGEWNKFRQSVQIQESESTAKKEDAPKKESDAERAIKDKATEILRTGDPIQYIIDSCNRYVLGAEKAFRKLCCCISVQDVKQSAGLHPRLSGESGMGKSLITLVFAHHLPPEIVSIGSSSNLAVFYHEEGNRIFRVLDDYVAGGNETIDTIIKQTSTVFHQVYAHKTVKDMEPATLYIGSEQTWAITAVDASQDIQVLNRQIPINVDDSEALTIEVNKSTIARYAAGQEQFFMDETVKVCREIWRILRAEGSIDIEIPYGDRIEWLDNSNRRNPSIFMDLVIAHTAIKRFQRERREEIYLATEDDFHSAEDLFKDKDAEELVKRLTKKERQLAECITKHKEGIGRNELASEMNVSAARISQLIHGEKNKGGLVSKMPRLSVEETTETVRTDISSTSIRKTIYKLSGYDPLSGFEKVVTLRDKVEVRDEVSKIIDNREREREESKENKEKTSPQKTFSSEKNEKNISFSQDSKKPNYTNYGATDNEKATLLPPAGNLTSKEISANEEADRIRDAKFVTPKRCEECGKNATALHEIGQGEFVMRMCKKCYDAYLDDISSV